MNLTKLGLAISLLLAGVGLLMVYKWLEQEEEIVLSDPDNARWHTGQMKIEFDPPLDKSVRHATLEMIGR